MNTKLAICGLVLKLGFSSVSAFAQAVAPCGPNPVAMVDERFKPDEKPDYNREKVGSRYAEFAAASYDVYQPYEDGLGASSASRRFYLPDNDPSLEAKMAALDGKLRDRLHRYGSTRWSRLPVSYDGKPRASRFDGFGGLTFDTYIKLTPDAATVLVAYRGTDSWLGPDLIANLSWITQWINWYDQYYQARELFPSIVSAAQKAADGRKVAFLATGHSLGGGLALHVAHRHDCVSAVVFNPSIVENTYWHGRYKPIVIRVYEDEDIFSRVARRFFVANSDIKADYRLNNTKRDSDQHNMENLAAGAMRMALECRHKRPGCQLTDTDIEQQSVLYCARYKGLRKLLDQEKDVCKL